VNSLVAIKSFAQVRSEEKPLTNPTKTYPPSLPSAHWMMEVGEFVLIDEYKNFLQHIFW
jgi:hypothetical protein